ncbi:MAG TPA: helix-turn-helix transcriptional regulator [Candidatus Limnocylindrales bacterium]|nr:helix-turn-helix transcriptional regulator [Candidatus Limnocylindrales bacterium]
MFKELRKLRNERNLTQPKVAEALEWSPSKLLRIENGKLNISKSDLIALLNYYEVEEKERVEELIEMARVAKNVTLLAYRGILAPEFSNYMLYESSASFIRTYQPVFVPGLLQTEGYAREIIQTVSTRENESLEDIEKRVQQRLDRQELLTRENAPTAVFILDEAVVVRRIGPGNTMSKQLDHLVTMSRLDNVTIRILPFDRGAHPGMRGPFILLEFHHDDMEDMLFLEHYRGDVMTPTGSDEISAAGVTFYQLVEIAESEERSIEMLQNISKRMRSR